MVKAIIDGTIQGLGAGTSTLVGCAALSVLKNQWKDMDAGTRFVLGLLGVGGICGGVAIIDMIEN